MSVLLLCTSAPPLAAAAMLTGPLEQHAAVWSKLYPFRYSSCVDLKYSVVVFSPSNAQFHPTLMCHA